MMKKIFLAGAALLMAMLMSAPSFALENKITGTLTLGGILMYNPTLSDDSDNKKTVDYREMQLRVLTESKVNDNITLHTRFNVLDKILSSQNTNTNAIDDRNNIQFDRAWMDIKTPVGLFRVGRKAGVKWGTDFLDDGYDWGTDRLEYILPLPIGDNKLYLAAVGEKALETQQQNRDNEKSYVTATYVAPEYKTGLLLGNYNYLSYLSEQVGGVDATNPTIDGTNIGIYRPRTIGQVYYIAPYFAGKLGPVSINAEFGYVNGKIKPQPNASSRATVAAMAASGVPALQAAAAALNAGYAEKDVSMMAYWLEGGYDVGPVNVQLGYAFMSGDKDITFDGDVNAMGLLAPGADWGRVFILTSGMGIHQANTNLPNGNITDNGQNGTTASEMNQAGLSMPYLGATYSMNSDLTLGALVAFAQADEAPTGYDKDYGMETDLTLSWKFLGNLEYKATAAYLTTGDFWKSGGTTDVGDMMAFYHELILSF